MEEWTKSYEDNRAGDYEFYPEEVGLEVDLQRLNRNWPVKVANGASDGGICQGQVHGE